MSGLNPEAAEAEVGKFPDGESFERAFRDYYEPLCRYAFSFLSDAEAAEEVVQDSFVSLWEKTASSGLPVAVKPYMFASVRNHCINSMRKNISYRNWLKDYKATVNEVDMVFEERVSAREQSITEALERLPAQCRRVFELSRLHHMKYAEIANVMSISLKTVENHMGRALKIIRQYVSDKIITILTFIIISLN